jgi:hypothetical protein
MADAQAAGTGQGGINTNLLMYYLAGTGRSLGGQGSVGDVLGQMAQQQIATESKATALGKAQQVGEQKASAWQDILSQILQNPDGKMTIAGGKLKLEAPQSLLQEGQEPSQLTGGLRTQPVTPTQPLQSVDQPTSSFISNFSQVPQISAEDLVGLTPQDITQAFEFGQKTETLGRQKVTAIQDMLYKQALMEQMKQGTIRAGQKQQLEILDRLRSAPFDVPGRGPVTADEWKEMPNDVKAYSYYMFNEKQGGRGETALSFNEWKEQSTPTAVEKIFKAAEKDEDFKKFALEYRRAGAPKISVGERAEETALGRQRAEIQSPEAMQDIMTDWKKLDPISFNYPADTDRLIDQGMGEEEAIATARKIETARRMDAKVRSVYKGQRVLLKSDGWYVDGVLKVPYAR